MSEARRVALPLAVTLAVQTLVAFAVYCAPVMAPVAGPALGYSPSAVGYYIAATYFGSMLSSAAAGGVLAGALAPLLILAFGWQWGAVAIGAACAALALAIGAVRERYDRELDPRAPISLRSAIGPVRMVLAEPPLRLMCITSFVYGGVQITLVTYLVTFLVDSFALTLVVAGLVMAVSQVASVIGRVLWGGLADRVLTRRAMLGLLGIGMGISALVALAASPDWPAWLLFVYAAAFGATAVGWNGVFLAEVARVAPAGRTSEATGGCLFFTFLGVVVAPPGFNAVLALAGSYPLAYATFAAPALAVGVWLLARMPKP